MYSVLLSDGMATSFTCATHLQSINRGDPHPLLPFDRGWPPPKLITECGYPHLPYSVWKMVGQTISMVTFVRALAFVMGGPLAKGMWAVSPFYNPTDWLAGPDLLKKAKKAKQ